MYDMLGRFASEDVRDRSVQALVERYSVDKRQARRVVKSCERLYEQVHEALGLTSEDNDLLRRTAYLHEIGLAISHSGYHHHSSYLLEFSDIPGFSQVDQVRMAQLARNHRRKLKSEMLEQVQDIGGRKLVYLCLLLRLAVLVHRSRNDHDKSDLKLNIIDEDHWQVRVESEFEEYALLIFDLKDDIAQFKKWGVELTVVQETSES